MALIDAAIERLDHPVSGPAWDRVSVLEERYERVELSHYVALGCPAEDLTAMEES